MARNSKASRKAPQEFRDFGIMHANKRKIPQSQSDVFNIDGKDERGFDRRSNEDLIKIVKGRDLKQKRQLSEYIAQINGIYARATRYIADVYRFDFMLYPNLDLDIEITDQMTKSTLKKFNLLLEYFDNSSIQLMARKWAAQVCLVGAYYGYISDDINDKLVIQDLPVDYCRSRFFHRGRPAVEFNVRYFDVVTKSDSYRKILLALFPKEIQDAYKKYLNGSLKNEEEPNSKDVWVLLDLDRAFKFNFYDSDVPPFLYAIPSILQLGEVQDLTKEKLLQAIQKILTQKLELNKQGEIPFTMKEIQRLNQNAADMVGDAVGISVLTTIADVKVHDLDNSDGAKAQDQVRAAENSVYNDFGFSTNLFNTDGNLALDKSVIVDEAFVKQLLLQFEQFFNDLISWKFNKKDSKFRMKMLNTTIFNYKELSEKYQALTKIGFSRFLPMVALGHTQKEVTSMVKLEQQMMQLDNWMLPPFSSNTMSSDTWAEVKAIQRGVTTDKSVQAEAQVADLVDDIDGGSGSGRPSLPDDQKSDKTIANRASQ